MARPVRPSSKKPPTDKAPVARRFRRYDLLSVLDVVDVFRRNDPGRSPSQRRIQLALAISAPSVVHNMLHRLARAELLTITTYGRGHRAYLDVTEAGQAALQTWRLKQAQSKGS